CVQVTPRQAVHQEARHAEHLLQLRAAGHTQCRPQQRQGGCGADLLGHPGGGAGRGEVANRYHPAIVAHQPPRGERGADVIPSTAQPESRTTTTGPQEKTDGTAAYATQARLIVSIPTAAGSRRLHRPSAATTHSANGRNASVATRPAVWGKSGHPRRVQ